MELSVVQWGQILTLTMIAIALGMDAFSLGVGLGMRRLSWWQMMALSLSIGLFHVLMPLLGMMMGQFLGTVMKGIAVVVGGGMLCFLGLNMLMNVIRNEKETGIHIQSLIKIFLLSLSVSVDSLSAGLSLGLFHSDLFLTCLMFGSAGFMMAGGGLMLGRFIGNWVGGYGEFLGGIILIILGSKFIF
jgi:manganese efflux pump family protein